MNQAREVFFKKISQYVVNTTLQKLDQPKLQILHVITKIFSHISLIHLFDPGWSSSCQVVFTTSLVCFGTSL